MNTLKNKSIMKNSITGIALSAAFAATLTLASMPAAAQDDQNTVLRQSSVEGYSWPTDQQVIQKLDNWRDQKFGVLLHWGIYSVPGVLESWTICSEDWISRVRFDDYEKDKQWYWSQKDSLNPVKFNPDLWAEIMKDAGMKYMIFTTKHHDGFCMYDSKYTDFSITKGPFASNPRSNVSKEVFDAYRKQGFMIGAYFSKPDWHCKWYWNPYYATPNRSHNYDRNKHPDWWNKYVQYTKDQLAEVTTDLGSLDILWLDGGWLPGEEVGLDSILVEARKRNPGLISVDRYGCERHVDYKTPEQYIPSEQLDIPWESCITLTTDWGYVPGAKCKTSTKVIRDFVEIVAKGGCLALGVGPTPEGTIDDEGQAVLAEIGQWLKVNGKAIYSTVNAKHYNDGKVWFTADKNGKTLYAIYALEDGEAMPETVSWTVNKPKGSVKLLQTGKRVKCSVDGDKVTVKVPAGTRQESLVFQFDIQ